MSETTPPPEQRSVPDVPKAPAQPARKKDGDGIPWRIVLIVAATIYIVLFAALNSDRVDVSFVFFSTKTSLVVVILLGVVIGAVGGYLARELRARRSKAAAPKK